VTALSDALAAAQARAIAALGKQYVTEEAPDHALYKGHLVAIGCADHVEGEQLLASWNLLRQAGMQAPAESAPKPSSAEEKASQKQRDYIADLCKQRNLEPPDKDWPLTKETASDLIDDIKSGAYDPAKYQVQF
jgi:hypothetical protein